MKGRYEVEQDSDWACWEDEYVRQRGESGIDWWWLLFIIAVICLVVVVLAR